MRKDALHFFGDAAAQAIGLHKIHGGEESRLAEEIGPRIVGLDFELVGFAAEGELFEGSGAFGKEDHVQAVVGPVWDGDFHRDHADFF